MIRPGYSREESRVDLQEKGSQHPDRSDIRNPEVPSFREPGSHSNPEYHKPEDKIHWDGLPEFLPT